VLLLVAFALFFLAWNDVRLPALALEKRKPAAVSYESGGTNSTRHETDGSLPSTSRKILYGFSNVSGVKMRGGSLNATSTEGVKRQETLADGLDSVYAWCVIDKVNMNPHFRHFPHTLQSLAPCWSYFSKVRGRYAAQNKEVRCGLYLNDTGIRWSQVSRWSQQLVEAWNCTVTHDPPPGEAFREHWRHRGGWFEKESDADKMRNQVLGASRRGVNARRASSNPRIGMVQRMRQRKIPDRIILNLDEIVRALQREIPSARVEVTDMKSFSLLEQARWWNSQDLVVLAHGAAVTNAIFMEPKVSAVVEIYPDDYLPYMFRALMRSCQVRSYSIHRNTSATARYRSHPRNVDLLPDVTQVVSLAKVALNESSFAE
jgi:hypothetical protein